MSPRILFEMIVFIVGMLGIIKKDPKEIPLSAVSDKVKFTSINIIINDPSMSSMIAKKNIHGKESNPPRIVKRWDTLRPAIFWK